VPAGGYVVDLGAGTGALSAAILDGLPEVRVQLVDVDPNMLETGAARCAAHAGRFDLRRGRFQEALPPCNAVVATLALHHVADNDEKQELYRAIHEALEPGGLVVVGDLLIHPEGPERRQMLRDWYAHMASNGITEEEADGHFAQWAEEDRYTALVEELELVAAAGFPRPDCFWRDGGLAVYGGFKNAG
jgi:tRNA (cmo5U34)-methyltransferase